MKRILSFVCLIALLSTACNLPQMGVSLTDTPTPTPTPTVENHLCAWVWATQPLPEISAQVESAFESAGLPVIAVLAEAYGENCVDSVTNEVTSFGAIETDFRITVQVDNLADREALGGLLERILVVLDGFPTGSTPGSQPGYVGVTFQAGEEDLNLQFLVTDGEAARTQGLHGAALLEKLTNK